MINEIWLPIKDFESYYKISNLGRVRSVSRYVTITQNRRRRVLGRLRKQQINYKGYPTVQISNETTKKTMYVHRLVAIAFITNDNNKPEVNHKDGNKLNNCYTNLEWVTSKENMQHAKEFGLRPNFKYESNPNFKLTHKTVQEAKILHSTGFTYTALGLKYNVSLTAIRRAIKGETWKH
jgi:hypothetical protein